jgi:hypothetical protein
MHAPLRSLDLRFLSAVLLLYLLMCPSKALDWPGIDWEEGSGLGKWWDKMGQFQACGAIVQNGWWYPQAQLISQEALCCSQSPCFVLLRDSSGCSGLSTMSFFPLFYLGIQFNVSFGEGTWKAPFTCVYTYIAGLGSGLKALASWPLCFDVKF